MNRIRPASFALAVILLAGCSSLVIDSVEQLRESNKKALAELRIGMDRAEVEKRMGDARAGGKLGDVAFGRVRHLEVKNPMRAERHAGSDGATYDVLFYYTDLKTKDDKITDDELTPIVFRDHALAGIGYGFLGLHVPKYAAAR